VALATLKPHGYLQRAALRSCITTASRWVHSDTAPERVLSSQTFQSAAMSELQASARNNPGAARSSRVAADKNVRDPSGGSVPFPVATRIRV